VESSNHEDFPNDVNTVYTIGTSGLTDAGTLTITVTASNHDGEGTYTINVPKPTGSIASGAYPASVVSYLPIGQFATGNGWGSASGKFVSGTGYASTGVSLGGLGGYIEFDFGEDEDGNNLGLSENAKNPYGVDFVVYGNAFGGNPEAGAVQVSENGTTWYELAGSLYYDGNFQYQGTQTTNRFHLGYTGVLRNADVIYTLNSSNITAVLKDAAGTVKVNGDLFTTATAWWPTATEYADSLIAAAHQDTNVTIARSGSTATSTLAYGGVTAIPDSDTTADYAFGYADVTPNGSPSTYGNAINPTLRTRVPRRAATALTCPGPWKSIRVNRLTSPARCSATSGVLRRAGHRLLRRDLRGGLRHLCHGKSCVIRYGRHYRCTDN
jgi:hypothetical protein